MRRLIGITVFALAWSATMLLPLGAIADGDSLTDEYSVFGPLYGSSTALSWVDQLATYRADEVDFGAFGDWRSFPRLAGYEYNYARLGATTTTLLSEGQHTGVASQSAQVVFVGIGTNDFSALSQPGLGLANVYHGVYHGTTDPAPLVQQLVANFTTALNTIAGTPSSPTGVQVVVGNVGDWGAMPYSFSHGYTDPAKRAIVTNAVVAANAQIREIALARGMPIVDIFGLLNLQLGLAPLTIGDVPLVFGTPPIDNPHYVTLPDGIHPGTLWQGLLANAVISAANAAYDVDLTPFTDQDLLAQAGVADPHAGNITTYYPIEQFVEVVPEPSRFVLAALGSLGIAVTMSRNARVRRATY